MCECLELRGRERSIREGKQTKKMWKKVTERLGFGVGYMVLLSIAPVLISVTLDRCGECVTLVI